MDPGRVKKGDIELMIFNQQPDLGAAQNDPTGAPQNKILDDGVVFFF